MPEQKFCRVPSLKSDPTRSPSGAPGVARPGLRSIAAPCDISQGLHFVSYQTRQVVDIIENGGFKTAGAQREITLASTWIAVKKADSQGLRFTKIVDMLRRRKVQALTVNLYYIQQS